MQISRLEMMDNLLNPNGYQIYYYYMTSPETWEKVFMDDFCIGSFRHWKFEALDKPTQDAIVAEWRKNEEGAE